MRRIFVLIVALLTMLALAAPTGAQEAADRTVDRDLPASLGDLKLSNPISRTGISGSVLDSSLMTASGSEQVIVRLASTSVAEFEDVRDNARKAKKKSIQLEQSGLLDKIESLDPNAKVLAQVQVVLNAVFVEVDASVLPELADDPRVERITPVGNYELDLSDTVPYIGASAVQSAGVDGSGVKVAVLDSGIDYTHANLGGGGTIADYEAAYGGGGFPANVLSTTNKTRDGLFPTAKVVDGFDFVGELWPDFGPLDPDDDPIDYDGHGTHVADIIGGLGGVAPGVDLYAVKVCASLSTSCSGVALIQGMEFSVDPDGDGSPSDAVDIINMSLGSNYGQVFDDDLSMAVENATRLGVLTVSSAGNGTDKPYVQGSPSGAPTAISVAQTQVPSAIKVDMEIIEPVSAAGFYEAVFQPWSAPLTAKTEGPVTYGDGAGGNLNGCAAFAPGSLDGIVAVDRGACNFSLKIQNIEAAGGDLGIIITVDGATPFPGGFGGGELPGIPGYMIFDTDGDPLRAGGAVVSFDPNSGTPLVGTMVGSSSRGPNFFDHSIKPEIGAPGASISAEVGTGTGETPFGGTSGASPMVAGSAALLLDGFDGLSPLEVKALLVNNAETDIHTAPGGALAPIARIGGGEVRVDAALAAPSIAWALTPSGTLSFGFVDVAVDDEQLQEKVKITNHSDQRIVYTATPTFRYADDEATGAVNVKVTPQRINIPAGGTATVTVTLMIDGSKLRDNLMNSGSGGTDPGTITANEYDGYLVFSSDDHTMQLPWHVLPRKAADVQASQVFLKTSGGIDDVTLNNKGIGTAQVDAYSLIALSEDIPEGSQGGQAPTPDLRAVGVNTFPVPAGFCSGQDSFIWAFAMNTHERQTHLVPVINYVDLDIDQDGIYDFEVFNAPLSYPALGDEREVTWATNLATGDATAFFFAEHATNTANTALYVCGEQVGLTGTDMLTTNVDVKAGSWDYYFGGSPADEVSGITVTPLGEQYFGIPEDITGNSMGSVQVIDFGPFPGNTDELGVLLFTNGDRGALSRGGATVGTEALVLPVKGVQVPASVDDNRYLPGFLAIR